MSNLKSDAKWFGIVVFDFLEFELFLSLISFDNWFQIFLITFGPNSTTSMPEVDFLRTIKL